MADGDVLGIVSGHQQFGPSGDYATPIDLSGTLATTVQTSAVLDTRGSRSIGLYVEVTDYADVSQSVNVLVLTRIAGKPWLIAGAIESNNNNNPTLSRTTVWPPFGIGGGGPIPAAWYDVWAGLLEESVILVQPHDAILGVPAGATTSFSDPDADLAFSPIGLSGSLVAGDFGNAFSVQFVDPGAADQRLRLTSSDGYALVIHCATDGGGAIVTTANDVLGAMYSIFNPFAPFVLTAVATGSGAGLVEATSVLPLSGGAGNTTGVTYSVKGSL